MIYIDPPYGIKFGSNWQVSARKRDVKDGKLEDASREVEQIKAFRDTWELGIHSYLTYLRDRLAVAKDLLTETGSIFVQIGDENVHLVRSLMDEVFGSENFVSLIAFRRRRAASTQASTAPAIGDYLLWYARGSEIVQVSPALSDRRARRTIGARYTRSSLPDGYASSMTATRSDGTSSSPEGTRCISLDNLDVPAARQASRIRSSSMETTYSPDQEVTGRRTIEGMQRLAAASRIAC